MAERPWLIQFPHPGTEHNPGKNVWMPWNVGAHHRKFLITEGTYTDGAATRRGELVFWGEWEPPSEIVEHYGPCHPGLPRNLHRPQLQIPPGEAWRQNTDPLVLGQQFLYSNCRQMRNKKLRRIPTGSIVLFGSRVNHDFVLDTCFVVRSDTDYTASNRDLGTDGPYVRHVVTDPVFSDPRNGDATFRLYRAAMKRDDRRTLFSFVPCRLANEENSRFARPVIDLPNLINPNLAMAARCVPLAPCDIERVWRSVSEQVLAQDLLLGVKLSRPHVRVGEAAVSSEPTEPRRC